MRMEQPLNDFVKALVIAHIKKSLSNPTQPDDMRVLILNDLLHDLEKESPKIKYIIRVHHNLDVRPKQYSTESIFPGTFDGLAAAKERAETMNSHVDNIKKGWEYRVFEHHGKQDYRPLNE